MTQLRESPFAELLGLELVEMSVGRMVIRLPFSDKLLQSLGRVHGGAVFSVADHAGGGAVYSTLDPGEICATLEMKINYMAALRNEDVIADAQVIHKGAASAVVEVTLTSARGDLIAKALATFLVWKGKPVPQ